MVVSRSLKRKCFTPGPTGVLETCIFFGLWKRSCFCFFNLCCIYNLSLVSNVCKAVPTSLSQPHNGFNELLEMHSEFPFSLLVNWQWLLNRPIMVCNKNLVRWWGPRTRILPSLFHRLLGWFSNRTGMSVDDSMRKSNNWLDKWHSGKLGTGRYILVYIGPPLTTST